MNKKKAKQKMLFNYLEEKKEAKTRFKFNSK